MFPAAAMPAVPIMAPLGRSPDQPSAYCPIPQRLITDLHDNPLAIGLYGLIARVYLVAQAPIPLSVPDVMRYDPTLSRGAVLRALARLLAGGYITQIEQSGRKTRYTPAWGRIGGAPLPWDMRQPCLGRPRHVARLRVDRRLLDICMGKLIPHPTRTAVITRYVTTPVLSLSDVGCYALTLAGVSRTTPALIRLGAVRDGTTRSLPSDERLLALISQRALDLDEQADGGIELTVGGARRLGVTPLLASDPRTVLSQPLFFVPPGMIGSLIEPMIGSMIGPEAAQSRAATAVVRDERRLGDRTEGITWEPRDRSDAATPPPSPPSNEIGGGGVAIRQKASAPKQYPDIESLPKTEAATALQAINVKPAQIAELAHMPLATVETAIADGRARPAVRDLAGWVVSLLRAHRDHGWRITPPAPALDSPEVLGHVFAREAAAQDATQTPEPDAMYQPSVPGCVEQEEHQSVDRILPAQPLVQLWNDMQSAMRTRMTGQEFNTWIRPAVLRSVEYGIAIISAPNERIKEGVSQRYTAPLCDLLTTLLGTPTRVLVVVHDEVSLTQAQLMAEAVQVPITKPAETAADSKAPPAPTSDYRPDWISANQWRKLPAMLRAALIGSTVTNGVVQAISPHLTNLIATRYENEIAALGVVTPSKVCHNPAWVP